MSSASVAGGPSYGFGMRGGWGFSLTLDHVNGRDRASLVPIWRVNGVDAPRLCLASVSEDGATIPNGSRIDIDLADVFGL
jgi:hypothetical protein